MQFSSAEACSSLSITNLPPMNSCSFSPTQSADVLVIEYHLWRAITQSEQFRNLAARDVLVTEAPAGADLNGAQRWEDFRAAADPTFIPRKRTDPACIVYSSGTGGRPKGCVLTHDNYLEQCVALTSLYPFWPGVRYLSILPTNHAIDFMVGFIGPFTCGADGRASPHPAAGIYPRSLHEI